MKTVILGAGAMGSVIGGTLAQAGNDVVLVDVAKEIVDEIEQSGPRIEDKAGRTATIKLQATNDPSQVGVADLVIVFVKCYHTETAVRQAAPMLGPNTIVLSLQNGWGNAGIIGKLTGPEKLLIGVSYHSAVLLAPGHVLHAGQGPTYLGEIDGTVSSRVNAIAQLFRSAGLSIIPSANVLREIWSKLALNAVTLPTSASIRVTADKLLRTPEMDRLMQELLTEVVAVALDENPGSPTKSAELHRVDLLIVSHAAVDHLGDTVEVAGIKVQPLECHHWSQIKMPDSTFASGVPMAFIVYTDPGVRFYHYGDTAIFSDLKLQGELYQPTIGCIGTANPQEILHRYPMPGRMLTAEMNPREGALAAQWLGLKTVLPCHYINPDCVEVREFERHLALAEKAGATIPSSIVLKPGQTIESE